MNLPEKIRNHKGPLIQFRRKSISRSELPEIIIEELELQSKDIVTNLEKIIELRFPKTKGEFDHNRVEWIAKAYLCPLMFSAASDLVRDEEYTEEIINNVNHQIYELAEESEYEDAFQVYTECVQKAIADINDDPEVLENLIRMIVKEKIVKVQKMSVGVDILTDLIYNAMLNAGDNILKFRITRR